MINKVVARRIARRLARHAVNVAPVECAEWSEAMVNEIDHLPLDAPLIKWAFGCILFSYAGRIRAMTQSIASVSRWILALEMTLFFTPLTLLFIAVILSTARGTITLKDCMVFGSVALVGPLGLMTAFKTIVLRRGHMNPAMIVLLGTLALWTVIAYSGQLLKSGRPLSDWWREFVLIAVLPTLAVLHLIWISSKTRQRISQ